jgi:hypothetical protein
MPVVKKVRGGRVAVRDVGAFEVGDTAEVDGSTAAYLCEERGDFERVDDTAETIEADAEADEAVAEPPVNPAEHTIDDLEAALAEGDYSDAELDAIADAEAAGEDRTGAHDVIDDAREG